MTPRVLLRPAVAPPASARSRAVRVRRRGRVVGLLAAVALLTACAGATTSRAAPAGVERPAVLRVGVVPNVAPERQRAAYGPLGRWLEQALGTPVELFVAPSYAGVVTALAAGRLDVAYLGGLTYVQAAEQVALEPVVTEVDQETGTPRYLSAVVVRADSDWRSVRELVDRRARFAFGDPGSTSGSLYPRLLLDEAGARCSPTRLDSCPPLASVRFTGGHDATALAVVGRRVDAGGLELRVLHRLERTGVVPAGELRVLQTREVMGYPWVVRRALDGALRDRVRQAFLDVEDPALLDLLRARDYVPVSDADYAEVRTQARRLGLLR